MQGAGQERCEVGTLGEDPELALSGPPSCVPVLLLRKGGRPSLTRTPARGLSPSSRTRSAPGAKGEMALSYAPAVHVPCSRQELIRQIL